jgi:hypothetical protein
MNQKEQDEYEFELNKEAFFRAISLEIDRSFELHGDLPENMFEQIVIINEEIGEVNKAILHLHYEGGNIENIRKELIESAAMCVKMLIKIMNHEPRKS